MIRSEGQACGRNAASTPAYPRLFINKLSLPYTPPVLYFYAFSGLIIVLG